MEPLSSTKLVDTSVLTSITTEKGVLQQHVPASILNFVNITDMPLCFPMHVVKTSSRLLPQQRK